MRILLVTGFWPTPDMPHAGIFVQRRVPDHGFVVVAPTSYAGPVSLRYVRLLLAALTIRGRFDGVEVHPLFPAGLVGLLAARIRGVPLVTYAHGADVRETAIENRLYRFLAKLVVKGSAALVTNSSDTAALVARLGGTATVITPGVDLARFTPTPRPSKRRVLYLGGTEARKGYDVARELADTLVGPGISTVGPTDVPALMAAHDIILVPSRAEPFGLVAAEAIASGRWVIARRVGGLPSIVEEGITGTLVDHDVEFAEAIANVPEYDPALIAARAEGFSLERSNAAMNAIWARLLARQSTALAPNPDVED